MWFGSGIAVAVAVAGSCSSDSTPSLGTSICRGCGPKKKKKKIQAFTFILKVQNNEINSVQEQEEL